MSGTQLTATVPTTQFPTGAVTMATSTGVAVSTSSFTGTAPPTVAPTISSIYPTEGASGNTLTIYGTNFAASSTVKFAGNLPATSVTFVNSGTLKAVVPSGFQAI